MPDLIQDLTRFMMGQTVDGELIVVCPHPQGYAVKREHFGMRFVHSISVVNGNGRRELLEDACPPETRSFAKAARTPRPIASVRP
jgi:hypothetical protein